MDLGGYVRLFEREFVWREVGGVSVWRGLLLCS